MTVLQALDRYYDRMAARQQVVAPGWSVEPIGIVLELNEDGSLLQAKVWQDTRGKPRPEAVPKWFSRSGTASTPYFLWDNVAYVLGLGMKDPGKTTRDHAAFRQLHLTELADATDSALVALCRFLEAWKPENGLPEGLTEKHLTLNIAFQLRGENGLLHNHSSALTLVERLRATVDRPQYGFCLIRGESLPLVRLHPKIKGVDGTASAEVPLVSFNADAFESYGKEQGYNAPTSSTAAFRYGAALNALLARGGRNRLRIADSTIAFWADASAYDAAEAENAARLAEDIFAEALESTTDEQDAARLGIRLSDIAKGRALADASLDLLDRVGFYVLGLAPNAARLSVRYWIDNDFAHVRSALENYANAVKIEPPPWRGRAPSVHRLLCNTTAVQEKADNIPSGLAGEVLRSVLTGEAYPRTWLAATVMRLRAGDDPRRGWHAAAIKACLSRMKMEEIPPVPLDPDNPNAAYQLGRLFAVLEAAQYAALGRVNATIADRFYGAASATPARVFGALLRGAKNHISDARKRNQGMWIEPRLGQIMARLPADLPRTLRLEDQGRFAIGYYHERTHRPAKAETANEAATNHTETR